MPVLMKVIKPEPDANQGKDSMPMTDVYSVARYIIEKAGGMIEALRLQKLAYYVQAWSLAWTGEPMFPERFQAWANGPVCRNLYDRHTRQYLVSASDVGGGSLTPGQRAIIDRVWNFYGDMAPQELRDLTHSEEPWLSARRNAGASVADRSEELIDLELMRSYYRRLSDRAQARV